MMQEVFNQSGMEQDSLTDDETLYNVTLNKLQLLQEIIENNPLELFELDSVPNHNEQVIPSNLYLQYDPTKYHKLSVSPDVMKKFGIPLKEVYEETEKVERSISSLLEEDVNKKSNEPETQQLEDGAFGFQQNKPKRRSAKAKRKFPIPDSAVSDNEQIDTKKRNKWFRNYRLNQQKQKSEMQEIYEVNNELTNTPEQRNKKSRNFGRKSPKSDSIASAHNQGVRQERIYKTESQEMTQVNIELSSIPETEDPNMRFDVTTKTSDSISPTHNQERIHKSRKQEIPEGNDKLSRIPKKINRRRRRNYIPQNSVSIVTADNQEDWQERTFKSRKQKMPKNNFEVSGISEIDTLRPSRYLAFRTKSPDLETDVPACDQSAYRGRHNKSGNQVYKELYRIPEIEDSNSESSFDVTTNIPDIDSNVSKQTKRGSRKRNNKSRNKEIPQVSNKLCSIPEIEDSYPKRNVAVTTKTVDSIPNVSTQNQGACLERNNHSGNVEVRQVSNNIYNIPKIEDSNPKRDFAVTTKTADPVSNGFKQNQGDCLQRNNNSGNQEILQVNNKLSNISPKEDADNSCAVMTKTSDSTLNISRHNQGDCQEISNKSGNQEISQVNEAKEDANPGSRYIVTTKTPNSIASAFIYNQEDWPEINCKSRKQERPKVNNELSTIPTKEDSNGNSCFDVTTKTPDSTSNVSTCNQGDGSKNQETPELSSIPARRNFIPNRYFSRTIKSSDSVSNGSTRNQGGYKSRKQGNNNLSSIPEKRNLRPSRNLARRTNSLDSISNSSMHNQDGWQERMYKPRKQEIYKFNNGNLTHMDKSPNQVPTHNQDGWQTVNYKSRKQEMLQGSILEKGNLEPSRYIALRTKFPNLESNVLAHNQGGQQERSNKPGNLEIPENVSIDKQVDNNKKGNNKPRNQEIAPKKDIEISSIQAKEASKPKENLPATTESQSALKNGNNKFQKQKISKVGTKISSNQANEDSTPKGILPATTKSQDSNISKQSQGAIKKGNSKFQKKEIAKVDTKVFSIQAKDSIPKETSPTTTGSQDRNISKQNQSAIKNENSKSQNKKIAKVDTEVSNIQAKEDSKPKGTLPATTENQDSNISKQNQSVIKNENSKSQKKKIAKVDTEVSSIQTKEDSKPKGTIPATTENQDSNISKQNQSVIKNENSKSQKKKIAKVDTEVSSIQAKEDSKPKGTLPANISKQNQSAIKNENSKSQKKEIAKVDTEVSSIQAKEESKPKGTLPANISKQNQSAIKNENSKSQKKKIAKVETKISSIQTKKESSSITTKSENQRIPKVDTKISGIQAKESSIPKGNLPATIKNQDSNISKENQGVVKKVNNKSQKQKISKVDLEVSNGTLPVTTKTTDSKMSKQNQDVVIKENNKSKKQKISKIDLEVPSIQTKEDLKSKANVPATTEHQGAIRKGNKRQKISNVDTEVSSIQAKNDSKTPDSNISEKNQGAVKKGNSKSQKQEISKVNTEVSSIQAKQDLKPKANLPATIEHQGAIRKGNKRQKISNVDTEVSSIQAKKDSKTPDSNISEKNQGAVKKGNSKSKKQEKEDSEPKENVPNVCKNTKTGAIKKTFLKVSETEMDSDLIDNRTEGEKKEALGDLRVRAETLIDAYATLAMAAAKLSATPNPIPVFAVPVNSKRRDRRRENRSAKASAGGSTKKKKNAKAKTSGKNSKGNKSRNKKTENQSTAKKVPPKEEDYYLTIPGQCRRPETIWDDTSRQRQNLRFQLNSASTSTFRVNATNITSSEASFRPTSQKVKLVRPNLNEPMVDLPKSTTNSEYSLLSNIDFSKKLEFLQEISKMAAEKVSSFFDTNQKLGPTSNYKYQPKPSKKVSTKLMDQEQELNIDLDDIPLPPSPEQRTSPEDTSISSSEQSTPADPPQIVLPKEDAVQLQPRASETVPPSNKDSK